MSTLESLASREAGQSEARRERSASISHEILAIPAPPSQSVGLELPESYTPAPLSLSVLNSPALPSLLDRMGPPDPCTPGTMAAVDALLFSSQQGPGDVFSHQAQQPDAGPAVSGGGCLTFLARAANDTYINMCICVYIHTHKHAHTHTIIYIYIVCVCVC